MRRRCAARSVTPCLSSFAGIGRCPHSGIPGAPTGPAFRSTITRARVDVERRVVDARREVVDVLEDDRAALVLRAAVGSAAVIFITAPSGQSDAAQDDERAARVERVVGGPDHLRCRRSRSAPVDVLAERPAGHGQRLEVEQVARSAPSRPAARRRSRSPPSGTRPAGLRSTSHGVERQSSSKSCERQVDADPPGEGDQVEDRVRRAADRVQDADRVLERLAA